MTSAQSHGSAAAGGQAGSGRWQFWIDRGGTFTDVVARRPDGSVVTHKLLSDNPEHYPDAALQGIRDLMRLGAGAAIPASEIEAVKMGTTVATNALLERTGDRTVLAVSRGFRDALRIGYQARPKLFERHIRLPKLLYERVIEVDGRYSAQGEELVALDLAGARQALEAAFDAGLEALAIVFMHGYRYPDHERAVAALAREIGFTKVSASHQVSPLMKLVSRGETTVVDAYLSPLLRRYVDQVAAELGEARLMFMQSNGGLTDARLFQGKDSILSGPAGGVVGAVRTSAMAGFDRIISFDMGGTSTDVAHYHGEYERAFETPVAGVRMRAPMMRIHTVAAGGGSILAFDGARYRVGPESAGANPGPASYRRGGPLTVTDCNVMLGKLNPEFFPKVFGPGADQPLDAEVVRRRFTALARRIREATGDERGPEAVAEGFLKIAVENMANAIKEISVRRGYDVSDYTLCCFGGAGGQHACPVADALGMTRVFIHPYAGVLSAYGMGLADIRAMREQAVEARLTQALVGELSATLDRLAGAGRDELARQGVAPANMTVLEKAHVRYEGTDAALIVDFADHAGIVADFEAAHRRRYGFIVPDKAHIVEAVSVEVIGATDAADDPELPATRRPAPKEPLATVTMVCAGERLETPVFDRDRLRPGHVIDGPAIIVETTGTDVIEPGWRAEITRRNHLVLTRVAPLDRQAAVGTEVDPVMLEVFNNLFMSIAEQMGSTLENTSYSVNIKERLDFSCAIFDPLGQLIANAPHLPVHLGSMSESVRTVIRQRRDGMKPGDVYVLNAPYNGGTHLPDITVITPVFDESGSDILFFVGSRGHHADIGGITPGSMPPDSRSVEEEGVLIDDFLLVDGGRFREAELVALLQSGKYPARNVHQNVADLKAQIAANAMGVHEVHRMIEQFGLDVVHAYMGHVQNNAEEQVRRVLDVLKDGSFSYELDEGAVIKVTITIDQVNRRARVDFTGTSGQRASNFNAPSAVCRAAVLYVFRTLVDDEIPMNEGCLKPIDIVIPEGSMLAPGYPAAVVAGNVETSQCITDALYGALGVLAASQGTMNNVTFGNAQYQYYETVCGGTGAGPDFDGASAVHSHMTNTRLTDPEVLEWRFPVLLEGFRINPGSGGAGRHRGGDGVIRRLRFLEPMTAAVLSNHRRVPPFGLEGGRPGDVGRNWVERADGTLVELSGTDRIEMRPGDVFVVQTPGGGGFGPPRDDQDTKTTTNSNE
ncbi:MAG: hydantoinase B/oxoprolinase family protein [Kiloniellales bacterium]